MICEFVDKFTFVVVVFIKFVVKGAIGNGFGGDSGCILNGAGTTSVGDDTCFEIVAGCFNLDVYGFN